LGGAERSVIELAAAQRIRGDDAMIVAGGDGPFAAASRAARLPTHVLGWSPRLIGLPQRTRALSALAVFRDAIRAAAALRRVVVSARADIVQAHTRKAQLIAVLGSPLRTLLVWHMRDGVPERRSIRMLMRLAIRRVDHAVALTGWLAAAYTEQGIVPRSGRIGVVGSGVDPGPLDGLAQPWLSGDRDPIVGYVGHIARWKGPHLLVEAAERLTDLGTTRFAIVGDVWFPAAESDYDRWLERRISESPVRDRIDRLAARPPAQAMEAIDVLVHTSTDPEPFGRVLVEAMVAGRPIVGFRHGAAAELLDDSTAFLADAIDPRALADAIRRAISDRDASRVVARSARGIAARFEPMRIAEAMATEYSALR
jgi:glycosyltransferase involved in cell wall biosynthesis